MLLTKHENQTFHNQTIYISGQAFINCTFTACTGLGFGIATEAKAWPVKLGAPVVGFGCAIAMHAMHNALPRGRFADARDSIRRAHELDPLSAVIAASVGVVEHLAGDAVGAVHTLTNVAQTHPGFAMAHRAH